MGIFAPFAIGKKIEGGPNHMSLNQYRKIWAEKQAAATGGKGNG